MFSGGLDIFTGQALILIMNMFTPYLFMFSKVFESQAIGRF